MMSEGYVEVLIKRKTPGAVKIGRIVSAAAAGCFILVALLGLWPAVVPAAACCAAAYFLTLYSHVEYEYTYVDKELQIDRILGKSRRKRMETLDMMQLEVFAPLTSHQLDSYRNRQDRQADYSSNEIKQPERRYLLCLPGRRIILEPTEPMVKLLQNIAPRKVFTW